MKATESQLNKFIEPTLIVSLASAASFWLGTCFWAGFLAEYGLGNHSIELTSGQYIRAAILPLLLLGYALHDDLLEDPPHLSPKGLLAFATYWQFLFLVTFTAWTLLGDMKYIIPAVVFAIGLTAVLAWNGITFRSLVLVSSARRSIKTIIIATLFLAGFCFALGKLKARIQTIDADGVVLVQFSEEIKEVSSSESLQLILKGADSYVFYDLKKQRTSVIPATLINSIQTTAHVGRFLPDPAAPVVSDSPTDGTVIPSK